MNVWQFLDNKELMQKYVDAELELGNTKANLVYACRQLKAVILTSMPISALTRKRVV